MIFFKILEKEDNKEIDRKLFTFSLSPLNKKITLGIFIELGMCPCTVAKTIKYINGIVALRITLLISS